MRKALTRWGILGTAHIARKNWLAIRHSGNGVVAAVASRRGATAARFIDECQAEEPMVEKPRGVEGYAALLAAPDIDAVYIPLPTGLRKEWVMAAARAGKHVVCEKPCAVSAADLREMLAACRRHRVQFMDGVMFMHSGRLEVARRALEEAVGPIRRVTSAFSFPAPPEFFEANIRADPALEPHGCVGDLGWYCIRLTLWALNWQMPRVMSGRLLQERQKRGGGAAPVEFSGELLFDGGISAGFYCSFGTANEQWAVVSGERGLLRISDFVLPFYGDEAALETFNTRFTIEGSRFHMEPGVRRWSLREYSDSHPTAQETNLFRNFAARIQSGRLNEAWPEWAWKTQRVMEGCLESARSAKAERTRGRPKVEA